MEVALPAKKPIRARVPRSEAILALGVGLPLVALLAAGQLVAALAVAAAVLLAALVLRYPPLLIAGVMFIVYSNAAVVAVRFHGVPMVLGMLAPAPLLIPIAYRVLVRGEAIRFTPLLPLVGGLLAVQTASALLADDPRAAMNTVKETVLEGVGLFILVVNAVRTRAELNWAVGGLIAAGAFMGGLTAYQQVTGTYHRDYGGFAQTNERPFGTEGVYKTPGQRRLCGPIGEQNRFAQIMLMLLPLAWYGAFHASQRGARWLAAGAGTLIAFGCALAFSRGAAVAFVLVLGAMTALRLVRPRQLLTLGVMILILVTALPHYQKRIVSIYEAFTALRSNSGAGEADGAVRGRLTAMLAAARVFEQRPLLGVGPGRFQEHSRRFGNEGGLRALEEDRRAHNLYLEMAAELGTIGLIVFASMILCLTGSLIRLRRRLDTSDRRGAMLAAAFVLMLAAYLATALFLHLSYIRYFWLMIGLAAAAACVLSTESEPRAALPSPGGA